MTCPKCGSENVNVQAVSIVKSQDHHGLVWWLCVGWWWMFVKLMGWLIFGLFMLIPKLFSKNKTKVRTKIQTVAICQNCGHKWNVR